MNTFTRSRRFAYILVLASFAVPEAASAQVNCYAAQDPAMRAHCQRQLMGIYGDYGRAQDGIVRDLNRTERNLNTFMQFTPSWSRGTWNTVRRGYYTNQGW